MSPARLGTNRFKSQDEAEQKQSKKDRFDSHRSRTRVGDKGREIVVGPPQARASAENAETPSAAGKTHLIRPRSALLFGPVPGKVAWRVMKARERP